MKNLVDAQRRTVSCAGNYGGICAVPQLFSSPSRNFYVLNCAARAFWPIKEYASRGQSRKQKVRRTRQRSRFAGLAAAAGSGGSGGRLIARSGFESQIFV